MVVDVLMDNGYGWNATVEVWVEWYDGQMEYWDRWMKSTLLLKE